MDPPTADAGAKQARQDWSRARRFLLVAAGAGLADILVGIVPLPERAVLALHDGLQLAAAATAAIACLAFARGHVGRARTGWGLLGTGAAAWALGQIFWTWYEVGLGIPVPVAGPSDVAYLTMYPLAVAGLLYLSPIADLRGLGRAALVLDGLLAALVVAVLAWPLLLDPAFEAIGDPVEGYVTVAYPLSDIVVVGLAGGALVRNRASWRSGYGLVYLGFLLILVADLGYATGIFQGSYVTGTLSDAGWIVGFLVLAASAAAPNAAPIRSGQAYAQTIGYILPIAAVAASFLAFYWSLHNEGSVDTGLAVAIALTILLAVVRQGLAGWEYRVATRQREAAQADYQALFANMTEGFAHCRMLKENGRLDFEYLRVNQHFETLTGLKDVVGKRVSQLIAGIQERNPEVLEAYARVAKGGRPERFEVDVKGLGRWFDITAFNTAPGEFVAVFDNITGRKRLELDLRERMKELTALSSVATTGAKAEDLQALLTQTVRSLEKAFLHDDAWVLARAGGLQATSEGPQPEGPELRSAFRSVNGEGTISVRYRSGHEPRDDGPFLKEERALVDAAADLLTTVMGRKVESERVRFQAHLLENVSQAVAATDLEGRVTYWNPAAERLFGWRRAEAIGHPIVELWGDVLVLSPQTGPEEPSSTGDYPMRRKDGSPVLVNLATSPLIGAAGALEGFIAIAQDATEARAQALALKRRERALTLISAVNEALIHADSEAHLLQDICDIAVEKGGYRMAWVGLARDTPGRPVEPVAWAGHEAGYLRDIQVTWDSAPRGQVTGRCIREGRTVTMRDMARDPAFAPWRDDALAHGYASSISLFLPLGAERGALMMYSTQPEAFEPDEVSLLEQMAADLAFGVRTLRLRAKEAALATMLDDAQQLSKIGAWEYDAATGKVTWTREVYRIHDVPESFDPSDAARDIRFYAGPDQERLDAAFWAAVEHGKPYDLELHLTTARGRSLDVRTIGIAELRDGKVVRVRGNIMDITQQKAATEAIRLSEARLLEAQRTAKVGSWELDLVKNELWWSDENYRIFGVQPRAFGATYEFFLATIHPDDREAVNKAYTTSVATRVPYGIEHRLVMKDGSIKWVYERCETFYGADGKPIKSVGTTQDITERKQAEEARRLVEAKDREVQRLEELNRMRMDFLNTAAHDLKTPLTPLKLQMATLRLKGNLDAKQKESLDLMDRNVTRFQVLVEDMLDAARLQAGKLKLRRESVALGPLVQEAVASFQEAARLGGLQVEVALQPDVRVDADPTKCMQVLMNLVSNAVKYTPTGGHVSIRVTAGDADAEVAVRDDGLGMTPDQLGRLFQPFVRLHEGQAGVAKGTGLGLYISKGIIESHGGRLWAESDGPGKGSTFHMAWPLAKMVGATAPAAAKANGAAASNAKKPNGAAP